MKLRLMLQMLSLGLCAGNVQADAIFGVGATFPNTIYQAWGKAYQAQTGEALVYTPVGSGKGIAEIIASRTDFGATDKPLNQEELDKHQLMQFPAVVGGVVPAVNLKGIASGQLLLDSNTLAAIYLGKITRWNDPLLQAINPGLALPNAAIEVLYRSDKSGTTFNFTNYLSKANAEWKSVVGEGLSVNWKAGAGAEKTEGMTYKIASTPNSIGYLDLADLLKKNLAFVRMKNHDGEAVSPSAGSFAAAAASAKWSASNNYYEILTDEPGKESWPITAATFILMERTVADTTHANAVLKFFDWAYRSGNQLADSLHYVPLPASVTDGIRGAWKTQVKDRAGKALW
ncbi:MAG: phosphate ABC transporter substrate-binding protein PstS [Gallionella sp.]